MSQLQLFTDPVPPVPVRRERKRRARSTRGKTGTARTQSAERFGASLQASGLPHVAVDAVKRSVFRTAKLRAFDFIVYAESDPNSLVYVGQRRKPIVEAMRDWETTFGDGFKALFAAPCGDGFKYRALDGETVAQPFDSEVRRAQPDGVIRNRTGSGHDPSD